MGCTRDEARAECRNEADAQGVKDKSVLTSIAASTAIINLDHIDNLSAAAEPQ